MTEKLFVSADARNEIPQAFQKCLAKLSNGDAKADLLSTLEGVGDAFTANDDGRKMKEKTLVIGQGAKEVHDKRTAVITSLRDGLQAALAAYDQTDGASGANIAKTQDGIPEGH